MKVLMQNRTDLFDKPGGDLVQMQKTKAGLEKLGVEVIISTELEPELGDIDVVHVFNITRVHETLSQMRHAKKHGKPVVVSPIYHRQSEIERYEKLGRTGPLRNLNRVLRTTVGRETLKNLVRLRDGRQRSAVVSTLQTGFFQAQREVLETADTWSVLAMAEADAIKQDFKMERPSVVAPNGIDPQFFNAKPEPFVKKFGLKDFVLCVSRVEDRKNQIRLIEAMSGLDHQLVFIGGANPNHGAYVAKFKRLVEANKDWVHYLGPVTYEELPPAYAAARIHVLPSWFEVVNLTALEAAAAGCGGVVSQTGYMREYLGDTVAYCDPASIESIRQAVVLSLEAQTKVSDRLKELSWDATAKATLRAYKQVYH